MAKTNRRIGHWYRAFFALVVWTVLIVVLFRAPASFVRSRHSFLMLMCVYLLAIAFSAFTAGLWLADRNRAE